ncbi:alanyl-tRNA editing protein [Peribacillus sp. SCS-37]|uniref:alanyl-tRNA editing protein n=1 Tax=Paraperibacillus esterisolvens TaxID=3115296 RepID=UPI0039068CD8
MTVKLFYLEPELTEWHTTVTHTEKEEGYYMISLAETAFYPEGGGQPADSGEIDGIPVLDVVERDGIIQHKLNSIPRDGEVVCRLNRERRTEHTQHHSGQHLLSAVCQQLYGYETISFHLGRDSVTIDLDTPELSTQQLNEIENMANSYIMENRPVSAFQVGYEEMKKLPLRKLPKVTEDIRIVTIEGIDVSACCGTHVARTAEIGILKLLKTEKQRGKTRLHFICGRRALKAFQELHLTMSALASRFSTSTSEVLKKAVRLEEDLAAAHKEITRLQAENLDYLAAGIIHEQNGNIIEYESDDVKDSHQALCRKLADQSSRPALVTNARECRLFIAVPDSSSLPLAKWFKENLRSFNGRGGGSATAAQAVFSSEKDLLLCIHALKSAVIKSASVF